MNTGLQIADDIIEEYNKLRMKREHRYLILRVSDDNQSVVIDQIGARESTFEQFKDAMPQDQPR